jgi:hypothetical protein
MPHMPLPLSRWESPDQCSRPLSAQPGFPNDDEIPCRIDVKQPPAKPACGVFALSQNESG